MSSAKLKLCSQILYDDRIATKSGKREYDNSVYRCEHKIMPLFVVFEYEAIIISIINLMEMRIVIFSLPLFYMTKI